MQYPEPITQPALQGVLWTTQKGEKIYLHNMETRHLFFTIRMIWNHMVPTQHRIEPYKRWNLKKDQAHLAQVVKEGVKELSTRDDLTPYFIDSLKHMFAVLSTHQLED